MRLAAYGHFQPHNGNHKLCGACGFAFHCFKPFAGLRKRKQYLYGYGGKRGYFAFLYLEGKRHNGTNRYLEHLHQRKPGRRKHSKLFGNGEHLLYCGSYGSFNKQHYCYPNTFHAHHLCLQHGALRGFIGYICGLGY